MTDFAGFVSVDVETAGPEPTRYALLSIGACLVSDPYTSIYLELKPVGDLVDAEALAVSGLSLERLQASGTEPAEAMRAWADWLTEQASPNPVMLAFNAPFDWAFVNSYFHRFLGHNPFGHSALDVKAFAMGALGIEWRSTSYSALAEHWLEGQSLEHQALQDARQQARLFQTLWIQSQRS
ncbi:MAG: 3'-5' exonuclease [Anaerolineales bacterium]|nr:3'-5' exonuclease [Anaerolineales bacterium]